jgi:hypothetical protein
MKFLRYFRAPRRFRPEPFWGRFYIFRNLPGIIPGRWGFGSYGYEFGSRNPGDLVGVFLKRIGLWPW